MADQPSGDLTAAVDEVFLGYWPDDLMQVVRDPYTPGALTIYAHRDDSAHIPHDGSDL